jgi:glycosyltransferase involved in cell wall biosynthesis
MSSPEGNSPRGVRVAGAFETHPRWIGRGSMKIAMIGPRGGGGIATHIKELSRHLEMRGNSVTFVSPAHLAPPLAIARYARKLAAGYDIVHVHGSYDIPALIAGHLATKALGGGTVFTTHGTGSRYWRPGKRWGALWRSSAKRVEVIISVSEFVRRRMVQILGENPPKHLTIYNGVDSDFFSPAVDSSKAKLALGVSGKYVLLYVGRLASNKGIGHLLRAMPSLRNEIHDVTLLIGGRGEMQGELGREAIELGVSDVVDFRGYIPQERLPGYYEASDVVVVPSTYEPGGITPLEAMSMKKPVIGARTGGIAESLTNGLTGLLVPPGDPGAIATAVKRLHDDPDLAARLGENGRAMVEKRFSWEKVAEDTLGAYSGALVG